MIQITDTVSYDDTKTLQQQSPEFQTWLTTNCLSKINDTLKPDSLDNYNRPYQYSFIVDNFTVILNPSYINNDISNWSISGYNINIKQNG